MRSAKLVSPTPNPDALLPRSKATLLDEFAKVAMHALLMTPVEEWPGELWEHEGRVSKAAYIMARKMLQERSRK